MIYFDNAATTLPKPPHVAKAVAEAIESFGNPSRGAHDASLQGLRCMLEARGELASLFGVGDPLRVAFTLNATAALNTAIGGINGHIVTTAAEHNSVLRPLHRRGNYSVVPLDSLGRLDIGQLEREIRADTAAIVMTHASNVTGNVFDIGAAGEICRRKGIRLVVDAAQTAGLLPLRIDEAGISALCFSGHKSLYGPQGTGGICLGTDFLPAALAVGGSGSESFSPIHPTVMPDALEAGTQNAHGIAGLLQGLLYIREMEGGCFLRADRVARYFIEKIRQMDAFILYGDLDSPLRTPVVSINHRRIDSSELALRLHTGYGIAIRAGAHCAPLMHKSLGTEKTGASRFSFSHFNTFAQVDLAVQALEEICRDAGT